MRTWVSSFGCVGMLIGSLVLIPSMLSAGPTFLNRQAFPLPVSLNEIGPFHKNFLKTFEVLTQWNNVTNEKVFVKVDFTFYDADSSGSQTGEDGSDDPLMTISESLTIPAQVDHWGKSFHLTAIGEKLNQGFDHPSEGAGLEVYVDAQITWIQYIPDE